MSWDPQPSFSGGTSECQRGFAGQPHGTSSPPRHPRWVQPQTTSRMSVWAWGQLCLRTPSARHTEQGAWRSPLLMVYPSPYSPYSRPDLPGLVRKVRPRKPLPSDRLAKRGTTDHPCHRQENKLTSLVALPSHVTSLTFTGCYQRSTSFGGHQNAQELAPNRVPAAPPRPDPAALWRGGRVAPLKENLGAALGDTLIYIHHSSKLPYF